MLSGPFSLLCSQRQSHGLAKPGDKAKQPYVRRGMLLIPDTIKFLLAVALIAGAGYGIVVALAKFPPEPSEITRPLPHEKLRQN